MNRSQWIALAAAIVLIVACFMPWVNIPSFNITISGVDTEGTRFGKPAYVHFFLVALIVILSFTKPVWTKRFNLLLAGLNLAWALKNFMMMTRCEAGECPEKETGIYLIVIASVALLITTFFPNMKIVNETESKLNEDDAT